MANLDIARNSEQNSRANHQDDGAWKEFVFEHFNAADQHSPAAAPQGTRAELLNNNAAVDTNALAPLPDSTMARAQILGQAAWDAIPTGVGHALLGTHKIDVPLTESLLGHQVSITMPNILENAAVGAAIGFAAKTLLPEAGLLGKIGQVALATYFTAPLVGSGYKVFNDARYATTVGELQFAGKELGTTIGAVAGSLPVGALSYKWGAAMGGKVLASETMASVVAAKEKFYDRVNEKLDSGIDSLADSLKRAISVKSGEGTLHLNTDALVSSGIPIGAEARSAIAQTGFGELARNLSEAEVQQALSKYEASGNAINSDALIQSGIPSSLEAGTAARNPAIEAMHPSRRQAAVNAILEYTKQEVTANHANAHPSVFKLWHGETARSLPAEQVSQALQMYEISGRSDLASPAASQIMNTAARLASETGRDFGTAYTSLSKSAPYVAAKMLNESGTPMLEPAARLDSIKTLAQLTEAVSPGVGQSKVAAIESILNRTADQISALSVRNVPMETVANNDTAGALAKVLSDLTGNTPGGVKSITGSRVLNAMARNMTTPGIPHTAEAIRASYEYELNGGNPARLDTPRVAIAAKLLQDTGSVTPSIVEVAFQQGFGKSDSALETVPWRNLEKTAQHFEAGTVTDYRLAGVVSKLIDSNIPVNRQNLNLAVGAMAESGGNFDANQVRAISRIATEATRSAASAPEVLGNFARAYAQREGINTTELSTQQVLQQLSKATDARVTPRIVADNIVQLQRASAGFRDHQLQDPQLVSFLVENGSQHPYAPQAINAVTRIIGTDAAIRNPQHLSDIAEFLDCDGRMKDVDLGTLNAAKALSEARAAGVHANPEWNSVAISPSNLKLIQSHPSYSVTNSELSAEVTKALLRANSGGSI